MGEWRSWKSNLPNNPFAPKFSVDMWFDLINLQLIDNLLYVVKQNEDGKWEGKLLVDGRIRCLAFGKDSEEEVHESLNLDWIQFAR